MKQNKVFIFHIIFWSMKNMSHFASSFCLHLWEMPKKWNSRNLSWHVLSYLLIEKIVSMCKPVSYCPLEGTKIYITSMRVCKFLNFRSNKQANQNQLLDYHLVLYQSHFSLWDGRDREAYNPLLRVKSVLAPKSNSCKQQPTTTWKNNAFGNIIRLGLNFFVSTADLPLYA